MELRLMRLFVTGGAGHTGCNFLKFYLSDSKDNQAVTLVRRGTNRKFLPPEFGDRLVLVEGDLSEVGVSKVMAGCDAVMHIAHQTLCPQVAAAALGAGISRVFFVTTTGVYSKFNDLSRGYREIEENIRQSGLDWTILRPTMIYGSERDVNIHKLLRFLDTHKLFPVFGDGKSLMQPVFASDLAMGLLLAVKNTDKTMYKEYNLPGRSPLTYNEIVTVAVKELGRKAVLIHIPHTFSLLLALIAESIFRSRSPVIRRLCEDKVFSWSDAKKDFGYSPGSFAEKIALEVAHLRSIGLLTN
jgi:nucleoside-diphosphate-sugar epimerase